MKSSIYTILIAVTALLSFTAGRAQIKNAKTTQVTIQGNCGMCEKNIEKAGNLKKVALVDWNKETKMATLTYDSKKTNPDEILKRIALAGYDSDSFLAPDEVYAHLHGCCQYDRVAKVSDKSVISEKNQVIHVAMESMLETVFTRYFDLKDALVQTDGVTASTKATDLLSAINAVKSTDLEMEVNQVWNNVLTDLKGEAQSLSDAKNTTTQRIHFDSLSELMYQLMKVSKQTTDVYYQHCPMANNGKGAHWLSKESVIKNPYFGKAMLGCGKTVEILK